MEEKMSLAYVKKGATGGSNPKCMLDPESGRILGENGHRIHCWEVEPAPGTPFVLAPKELDHVDFEDDGWLAEPFTIPAKGATSLGVNRYPDPQGGMRDYFPGPRDPGLAQHMLSAIDKWWGELTTWRPTTVGALKAALGKPAPVEEWVLDASTIGLAVWKLGSEDEAVSIGIGESEPTPRDQEFKGINAHYLIQALRGKPDQLVYIGWAKKDSVPIAVVFDDQPFWAMIMPMRLPRM
jgi:hypothetical protein